MGQMVVDGRAVDYGDEGQGPPALLFHSSGMARRQWSTLTAQLRASRRVLRPDFWGAGATTPWPAERAFAYGEDVALGEALLLDVTDDSTPADLVGHSYGGLVALQVALRQPTRVRRVAVYEPVAFGVLHSLADEAALAELAAGEARARFSDPTIGGTETWLEQFIDFWNEPGAWKLLPAAARTSFIQGGAQTFAEVRSLLADRTTHQRYGQISAPTLILNGDRSPSVEQRVCAALAGALPHARRHVVAGAGHMGPITHGPVVNQLIVDHLLA